ncbi:MAG TPA: hypothetical protein DCP92_24135 [Nitrospiraceae bacterium]|nr:hypothetical protein [Nitrospiraceae bacterium]
MAITKEQVFEFIDTMTILDMSQFIKEFEERYGVTAAAPVAVAAAPGAAAAAWERSGIDETRSSPGRTRSAAWRGRLRAGTRARGPRRNRRAGIPSGY